MLKKELFHWIYVLMVRLYSQAHTCIRRHMRHCTVFGGSVFSWPVHLDEDEKENRGGRGQSGHEKGVNRKR